MKTIVSRFADALYPSPLLVAAFTVVTTIAAALLIAASIAASETVPARRGEATERNVFVAADEGTGHGHWISHCGGSRSGSASTEPDVAPRATKLPARDLRTRP